MTAFAFILGVVPLVLSSGAGAASRVSLGTAVFGGMLIGTILGVFVVPSFYVVFQGLSEWWSPGTGRRHQRRHRSRKCRQETEHADEMVVLCADDRSPAGRLYAWAGLSATGTAGAGAAP